jgi:hydrogenase nickel incorporation protein HypA/HybF
MHEASYMKGLMQQLQSIAEEHQAKQITGLRVKVGALTHFSKEHFIEHFVQAAQGTLAEGAKVEVELLDDESAPHALDIILDQCEITCS